MKLVSVAEMVATEQAADAAGHSYDDMMEFAGRGLAEAIRKIDLPKERQQALALVGPGNNGGDALVALAYLAGDHGWPATAYLMKSRGEDDLLLERFRQAGGYIFGPDEPDHPQLADLIKDHGILMDGLLGTGVQLPLRALTADLLSACQRVMNDLKDPPYIVAVDCPSGIDCDTGEVASQALRADLTVTMAAAKKGMLQLPALGLLGRLTLAGIGLPAGLPIWEAVRREVVDSQRVTRILPTRPLDAHKGTFGTVMVVGGSNRYMGAPYLSGKAAYRSGTGLVSLALPQSLQASLAGQLPEAIWLPLPEEAGGIGQDAAELIWQNSGRVTSVALGPGMGVGPSTAEFVRSLVQGRPADANQPFVIDADGLRLIAQIDGWPDMLPDQSVLTPHPGEMSALTGLGKYEIQEDRIGTAEMFAHEWGHVVVLKGAGTVVASPDGRTGVIPVATPALARAGTGDVLTGIIAGLLGQGVEAFEAAISGVWIHAQAGLAAAERIGTERSVLAGDVLDAIPVVLAEFEKSPLTLNLD